MKRNLLGLAVIFILAGALLYPADAKAERKVVFGSFVKFDADKMILSVKDRKGANVDFVVTKDTIVAKMSWGRDKSSADKNAPALKITDLKLGDRLAVNFDVVDGKNSAIKVVLADRNMKGMHGNKNKDTSSD